MADKNKSVDDIQEKIRRLQKEKEELERKNKESQLEQLRFLEEDISALRSSTPGSLNVHGSSSRNYAERSPVDIRSRLSNPNLNLSESDNQNDSREKSQLSEEDSDEVPVEEEMTPGHKRAILENRNILVENMMADDLFSELIAKRVLTVSDVNRIKDKGSAEGKNEELLNVICKRSDRAFYIFVDALKKNLQEWLALKLDPPTSKKRMKRKRKSGELRVNVDCESVVPSTEKKIKCSCQEVEEDILRMAKNAYALIKRKDSSPAAYEQFKKELEGTNKLVLESAQIIDTIKMICRHGKLTDISDGSVSFKIRCKSLAACEALWETFSSGAMLQAFQVGFVSPCLLEKCGAKSIKLRIRISRFEYLTCALELAKEELNCLSKTPIKMRLRQTKIKTYLINSISTQSGVRQESKYTSLKFQKRFQNIFLPNNLIISDSSQKDINICSSSVAHAPLKVKSFASLSDNIIQNPKIPLKYHASLNSFSEKNLLHNCRTQRQSLKIGNVLRQTHASSNKENIPTMNNSVKLPLKSHYFLRSLN